MKKIIVKARLKNHEDYEGKLSEAGMDFSNIYWLHDRVYLPREYRRGMCYPKLVVRTEMQAVDKPAKYFLILRRHIEDSGVDVVDETEVKNYSEAVNIVRQMGCELACEVSRRRQEIKLRDGVKIYMDKVEGLAGYYTKMEKELDESEKVGNVREGLISTLRQFGVSEIVEMNYFEM